MIYAINGTIYGQRSNRHARTFLSKNAIPDTMVPAMLVEGKQKLDLGKKRIEFGAYAMLYVGTHNNIKREAYQQAS